MSDKDKDQQPKPRPRPCRNCNGSGFVLVNYIGKKASDDCPVCGGSGEAEE